MWVFCRACGETSRCSGVQCGRCRRVGWLVEAEPVPPEGVS